ncbi:sigma-70 family RNA polymerase sigma factor [Galbibacter sp. EGI 63066]|uniref:sigma-70 family RNA polymerase sigma factor n=1 Tax=Galbibacter sp. EGI 63066 TaxID=2993559 RepID=UPI002248BF7E|nr:sigma-70 family RNA polymerase sigma factor [Galbibacter sp. EGI 63066]MCX2680012.1 sigma-70 family RNA polymerase sigma factor [Galbibacter sp. EGI 63066]
MDILQDYQSKLFPYAYNILGSIDDANDVIQDVVVNYIESNRDAIKNESAYLIKSVINKSINLKKRSKKMVGQTTWLPEPVATENADTKINSQEIISYSMLVLLEYLNPKERGVFILKQVFDYSHQEIAELFSISIENSRKLLSRAKNTLKKQDSDFKLRGAPSNDFLSEFVDTIRKGEVKMLEEMLSEHITAQTDGGGKIKVLSEFTSGIKAVALFAVKVYDLYLKKCRIEFKQLNHSPALLFYKGDRLRSCEILDIDINTGKISNIYSVVDPNKLKRI